MTKLSILIATMGRREEKFRFLLHGLMQQVERYRGRIEVIAYWNNGERPIGEIRQALMKEARGDYLCFVDDDDELPEYYCREIIKALGKDYVGFEVKLFNTGITMPKVVHSIKYPDWYQDDEGCYRDITHLNPIKREIALRAQFGKQARGGEDYSWASGVRQLVKTEKYIDKIMYIYHHDMNDSSFGGDPKPKQDFQRPEISYPYFHWHPDSKLTSGVPL